MKISKQKISKNILALTLGCCGLFGSLSASAAANCTGFTLTSNLMLLGPNGPAIGTAVATMDNGAVVEVDAYGEITQTKVSEEGIIHMRVEEADDWGFLGTTLGFDKLKLTPTATPGVYDMTIKTSIQGETGSLEEVHGHYRGEGNAYFNSGTINHSGSGIVCNLPF